MCVDRDGWRKATSLNGDARDAASRAAATEASAFSAVFCAIACGERPITSVAAKVILVLVCMIVTPPKLSKTCIDMRNVGERRPGASQVAFVWHHVARDRDKSGLGKAKSRNDVEGSTKTNYFTQLGW
jgi:hypothetical protein